MKTLRVTIDIRIFLDHDGGVLILEFNKHQTKIFFRFLFFIDTLKNYLLLLARQKQKFLSMFNRRILCATKRTVIKEWVTQVIGNCNSITRFIISNALIRNTRFKLAKNQAKVTSNTLRLNCSYFEFIHFLRLCYHASVLTHYRPVLLIYSPWLSMMMVMRNI